MPGRTFERLFQLRCMRCVVCAVSCSVRSCCFQFSHMLFTLAVGVEPSWRVEHLVKRYES